MMNRTMRNIAIRSAVAFGFLLTSLAAFAQFFLPPVSLVGASGAVGCATVSQLAAWYNNAGIVGSPNVTAWNDSSSGAHNMTCANNPQKFTMLNGLPGVQTNGTNQKCQSPAFSLPQPFTIYAIFNPTVIGSSVRALEGTDGTTSPNWVLRSTTMGWNTGGTDGLTITPIANTIYFIHAIANGLSNSVMALNSNADTTGSAGGTASMSAFNIGGGNASDFSNVAFGEICIYSKAIASGSADDTLIRTYFTSQWTKP